MRLLRLCIWSQNSQRFNLLHIGFHLLHIEATRTNETVTVYFTILISKHLLIQVGTRIREIKLRLTLIISNLFTVVCWQIMKMMREILSFSNFIMFSNWIFAHVKQKNSLDIFSIAKFIRCFDFFELAFLDCSLFRTVCCTTSLVCNHVHSPLRTIRVNEYSPEFIHNLDINSSYFRHNSTKSLIEMCRCKAFRWRKNSQRSLFFWKTFWNYLKHCKILHAVCSSHIWRWSSLNVLNPGEIELQAASKIIKIFWWCKCSPAKWAAYIICAIRI